MRTAVNFEKQGDGDPGRAGRVIQWPENFRIVGDDVEVHAAPNQVGDRAKFSGLNRHGISEIGKTVTRKRLRFGQS